MQSSYVRCLVMPSSKSVEATKFGSGQEWQWHIRMKCAEQPRQGKDIVTRNNKSMGAAHLITHRAEKSHP